jgi:hypothetical protein
VRPPAHHDATRASLSKLLNASRAFAATLPHSFHQTKTPADLKSVTVETIREFSRVNLSYHRGVILT